MDKDIRDRTRIVNLVVSTSLEHKIPLDKLIMNLPNTEYNPEQFPGLIMKIKEPNSNFLIFSSGKIVCTGTKSVDVANEAIKKLIELLKKVDVEITITPKVRVENIVASSSLDMKLDLNEIAVKLTNIEYEPEQFPGLVFKVYEDVPATFLIFGNGNIVCTGTKDDRDVYKAIDNLIEIFKRSQIKNHKVE